MACEIIKYNLLNNDLFYNQKLPKVNASKIASVDEDTFFFVSDDNFLGKVKEAHVMSRWAGNGEKTSENCFIKDSKFENISSICINHYLNELFLLENNALRIRSINLGDNYVSSYDNSEPHSHFTYEGDVQTDFIVSNKHEYYYLISNASQIFLRKNCSNKHFLGNMNRGYSNNIMPKNSCFNFPKGICSYDNGFLISDTYNNCIRFFDKKKMHTVLGDVGDGIFFPSRIRFSEFGLFFKDEKTESVWVLDPSNEIRELKKLDRIIDFDIVGNTLIGIKKGETNGD